MRAGNAAVAHRRPHRHAALRLTPHGGYFDAANPRSGVAHERRELPLGHLQPAGASSAPYQRTKVRLNGEAGRDVMPTVPPCGESTSTGTTPLTPHRNVRQDLAYGAEKLSSSP